MRAPCASRLRAWHHFALVNMSSSSGSNGEQQDADVPVLGEYGENSSVDGGEGTYLSIKCVELHKNASNKPCTMILILAHQHFRTFSFIHLAVVSYEPFVNHYNVKWPVAPSFRLG